MTTTTATAAAVLEHLEFHLADGLAGAARQVAR